MLAHPRLMPTRLPDSPPALQAWSASMKAGAFSTVQAAPLVPPKQWVCLPVPGFYPLCSAASAGQCTPLNCKQQVRVAGRGQSEIGRLVQWVA